MKVVKEMQVIDNMYRKIDDWMHLCNPKIAQQVVCTCLISKIQNSATHLVQVFTNSFCTRTIMIPISDPFHNLSFNHQKPNNRFMYHSRFLFTMHYKVYKHRMQFILLLKRVYGIVDQYHGYSIKRLSSAGIGG